MEKELSMHQYIESYYYKLKSYTDVPTNILGVLLRVP